MDGDPHPQQRIVITGIGVLCPAGRSADQFWQALTAPDNIPAESAITGKIDDFGDVPKDQRRLIRKALKLMNRETHLGVAAGQQALSDSAAAGTYAAERFGVCFGADNVSVMPEDFQRGIEACAGDNGEFAEDHWGERGIDEMEPLWLLKCLPNMPACHLAILNDLRGPSNTITQRDVSANLAIAEACRGIRANSVDAVLVGATGTTQHLFNRLHARLENQVLDDSAVCRPFDRNRTGAPPGEGAGAIVLERLDSALNRGAHIYGEVLATASACSFAADGPANCRKAATLALQQTLQRSGQTVDSIGHIHAHGLGTWESDVAEAQAVAEVFGAGSLPVVAASSLLANAAAGAGMLELVASLLALQHGHLFPVHHFQDADPGCPVQVVTDCDQPAGDSFLNLNMFGRGLASCTAIGKRAA